MDHPISVDKLSPQVAKICGPSAPAGMKAMAAGGLAPLPPKDLVTALYVLTHDGDNAIAQKAEKSLSAMPPNVLEGAVDQLDIPHVLDGIAHILITNIALVQKILLNSNTAVDTVVFVAQKSASDKTLEIIANNERRLLEHPEIIEALYKNKHTRMSTVDRTVELAVRNNIALTGIACFEEVKAAIAGELILEPTEEPSPEDKKFTGNLESKEWDELDEETVDAAYDEEDEEAKIAAQEKVEKHEESISEMSVSGKVRLATLGNANQRSVLIRDSNKLVLMAVVKSPALNDSEVMRFSQFRTLPEEVLRYMAGNREWTKHYTVKHNLVQNPRCPIEYALRFLPHLRAPDLRGLSRNRNVSQAVARAAKQLMQKRM